MHNYHIVKTFPNGVIEICQRCRDKQYFKNNTPNYIYLSFHLRSMLQKWHPRFHKEYEKDLFN